MPGWPSVQVLGAPAVALSVQLLSSEPGKAVRDAPCATHMQIPGEAPGPSWSWPRGASTSRWNMSISSSLSPTLLSNKQNIDLVLKK